MFKLKIRNLSAAQIEAFTKLFPVLTAPEHGLVERRGTTQLVIKLHPDVFRRADRQASAGTQLAEAIRKVGSTTKGINVRTVQSLAAKFQGAIAEEV